VGVTIIGIELSVLTLESKRQVMLNNDLITASGMVSAYLKHPENATELLGLYQL